jgi:hypothetical protein
LPRQAFYPAPDGNEVAGFKRLGQGGSDRIQIDVSGTRRAWS